MNRPIPPADMSEIRLIGTCYTCAHDECATPKRMRDNPSEGCAGWANPDPLDDDEIVTDEVEPVTDDQVFRICVCRGCHAVLSVDNAEEHQCPEAHQ